jgi:hypothetical protein
MGCAISGPCELHASFKWASCLADSGYAKSEDPMGHVLVRRRSELLLEVDARLLPSISQRMVIKEKNMKRK